jgi:hypothetical protein
MLANGRVCLDQLQRRGQPQECEFTVYVNPESMGYKIVKILDNLINNASGLPGILLISG